MPSSHLILCRPLLLPPSIFPRIRVFSNESALHIRWPNYGSFSFNISPTNEYPGSIFRMDCLRVPWTARRFNQSILKEISPDVHWKDWCWSWSSNNLATWCEELTHWKRPWCSEKWRQEEKGTTEDEMVVWYQQINGHEFEQALGDSEGQGSLACCSPWGPKELDTTEWTMNNKRVFSFFLSSSLSLSFLFFMA